MVMETHAQRVSFLTQPPTVLMKTSVCSSLPVLTHATTSWEAFPVPVPLASPSLQRPTHAKILMSVPRAHTCATTTSSVSIQWAHIAARPSVDQDLSPASQEPAVKMWMSAKSLLSPHASISVSIPWAPSAVSVTLDTSYQDIVALTSMSA